MTDYEDSRRVVRSDLKFWDFAAREKKLYERAARDIPTWRAANQARKHLAGVVADLSNTIESPAPGTTVDALAPATAKRLAVVNLGAIVVRSTSAIMSLIGCGHEREALGHARTVLEALLRAREAADDSVGRAARLLLQGRKPSSLKSAADRYGSGKDIELLNRFAHADVLSLLVVSAKRSNGVEADLELRPQRGDVGPASQLYTAAYTAGQFSGLLAEVFEVVVEVPGYLSGQLIHYRDNPLPGGA